MRGLVGFAAVVGGVPLAAFLLALWATGGAPSGPPDPTPGFAARIEVPAPSPRLVRLGE